MDPVDNSKKEQPVTTSDVSAISGTIKGHAWVDLGLSVKWATMNVGADSPGDYGDYFAWGEVHPKSEYTIKNNQTWEKDMGNISGNSQYDAARYHWGSSWRLPTLSEFQELIDKSRWTWTKENGHVGYKIKGPNGNSIFLPDAGYRRGISTDLVGKDGYFWSGSPSNDTRFAYRLGFFGDRRNVRRGTYYDGHSVRPVLD